MKEVTKMANFFKNYGVSAYQKKHQGEQPKEDLSIPKNAGCTVPDPKSLGNNKKKGSEESEESEEN